MNTPARALAGLLVSLAGITAQAATRPISDVAGPRQRVTVLTIANQLTQVSPGAPSAGNLADPFNPLGFDGLPPPVKDKVVASEPTDREILESIASQLPSVGRVNFQDQRLVAMGGKHLEVGHSFTVPYNHRDYRLELAAITDTTFTLRYRNEEITREFRPLKK